MIRPYTVPASRTSPLPPYSRSAFSAARSFIRQSALVAMFAGTFTATGMAASIEIPAGDSVDDIALSTGDDLTNYGNIGHIDSLQGSAVNIQNGSVEVCVDNYGTIGSLVQYGISVGEDAEAVITNEAGASISGISGVFIENSENVEINNEGSISSYLSSAIVATGADTVVIYNSGDITGNLQGVTIEAREVDLHIGDEGSISSWDDASDIINISGYAVNVSSSGEITSNGSGKAVALSATSHAHFYNAEGGVVTGDVFLSGPGVEVLLSDSSVIDGDITLEGANITFRISKDSESLFSELVTGEITANATVQATLYTNGDGTLTLDKPSHFGFYGFDGGTIIVSNADAVAGSRIYSETELFSVTTPISITSLAVVSGDLGLRLSDEETIVSISGNLQLADGEKFLRLTPDVPNLLEHYKLFEYDTATYNLGDLIVVFDDVPDDWFVDYDLTRSDNALELTLFPYNKVSGPVLQNSAPVSTPTSAIFVVNGMTRTGEPGELNGIRALEFKNKGHLQVSNILMVNTGRFFVHRGAASIDGDYIISPTNFEKDGPGTLVLGSKLQTLVDRALVVARGRLVVNGSMDTSGVINYGHLETNGILQNGGDLQNYGILSGTGETSGLFYNHGVLSPGNSPGTLVHVGDFVQSLTGSLHIEVESQSRYDAFHIAGYARLGGALVLSGNLQFGEEYLFLTADGIIGDFDRFIAPDGYRLRLFKDDLLYSALIAPESYTQLATNANHLSVAKALDRFIGASGDRDTVSLALDRLSADEYYNAFQQISPALHETIGTQAVNLTQQQGRLLQQRVGTARYGIRGGFESTTVAPALQTDRDGKSVYQSKGVKEVVTTVDEPNRWSAWVEGNGVFSKVTQAHQVPNGRTRAGGFVVGTDYAWNPNFITGLFAGYEGLETKYTDDSRATMNGARFGGYGTYSLNNGLYFDGIVWGGAGEYEVHRRIDFGSIDRIAHSTQKTGEVSAILGTGYDWQPGNWIVGPTASMQYTYVGIDGFEEHGAKSLNLDIERQRIHSLRSNLGGRLAYRYEINANAVIVPELRASWEYELLNDARNINGDLAGKSITYRTEAGERSSLFAGAGINALFNNRVSTSVHYNVDVGRSDDTAHIISASFGVQW